MLGAYGKTREPFTLIQRLHIFFACHFQSSRKGHINILGAQHAIECTSEKDTSSTENLSSYNINFMNDLSFDDGFGRILLEEEPWEQEEEPREQEEDFVDEPNPSCCTTNIPETKEQPQVKIYKRKVDPEPSFLDKHKAINEDNKKEEDLALGDLDLNIDIEKELSKIKQDNV